MILAYYAHFFIPLDEPIDLLTVAFSTTRHTTEQCPDRITARQGLLELNALANRKWRLVCIDVTFEESEIHKRHILECAWPSSSVMDLVRVFRTLTLFIKLTSIT